MKLGKGLGLQYQRSFGKSFLLDDFAGASIAYSLRHLSSSYSGDVVLVRRSSDNSEQGFTPTGIIDSFRDCSGVPSVASGEICAWINVPGGA